MIAIIHDHTIFIAHMQSWRSLDECSCNGDPVPSMKLIQLFESSHEEFLMLCKATTWTVPETSASFDLCIGSLPFAASRCQ